MMTSPLLFNATIAGFSVSAAFEIGLLQQMAESNREINLSAFCREKNLYEASVRSMVFALQCFQILDFDAVVVSKGSAFEQIYQDRGYFVWMAQGYGKFLLHLSRFLQNPKVEGEERNSAAIAAAGREYGTAYVDPYVDALLSEISWEKIADLGCGSAHRILQIVKERKCRAIGVEIQTGAIEMATEAVARSGLAAWIQIVQADVSHLSQRKEFLGVDLITSFFMGHDLWPREKCIQVFRQLKISFPDVQYFLFCDTFRSDISPSPQVPTFTLGFEMFHTLMRQYIPNLAEWRELFEQAGWKCVKEIQTEIPFTNLFLLTPLNA